jgi:hypothetical protein
MRAAGTAGVQGPEGSEVCAARAAGVQGPEGSEVASIHRGRASVMLARLTAARDDAVGARAWFNAALADRDPAVVAAARAGLAALER